MAPPTTFRDMMLQDLWVHLAGVIVIAFGIVDLWLFRSLSHDTDLLFILGGVAGMGLKIANGSTAALRTVALDTAFSASRAAGLAAAAASTVVGTVVPAPPPADPSPPPPPTS
jgi:hypothetical protein